jgi:hypothetical protein
MACALVAWTLAQAAPSRADTARYAVVIGNDQGAADEPPLHYAESDAQRVAALLGEVGGVPGENLIVLRGRTADDVRRALLAVNERIRTARPGAGSVLLVYYSGHGDADALHLGNTLLPLGEIGSIVRGSPATARVLIVDACRSGAITHVKGGRPAPPLALATAAPLSGEGMIVLTASALSEDAQESDALGGSFFTHYLLSGLRGAADEDGDRVITVAEAFDYARAQTIIASSRTLAGTQHPTFFYDLRGRTDLPLADLGSVTEHGTLTLPPGATWLVLRAGSVQSVVGEIAADARSRTLSLPPGSYAVRGRARDALLEATAIVAVGRDTAVDPARLERMEYAALVHKGRGEFLAGVSGPFAGYTARSLILYGQRAVLHGGVAGWTWVRPSLTLSSRLSAARYGPAWLATLDLRATRAWELGRFAIDLGCGFGTGAMRWSDVLSFSSKVTPVKPVVHIDATLGITVPLRGRGYLAAELAVQSHVLDDVSPIALLVAGQLAYGVWL